MVNEKPIIFSTDMVNAILEGRKTQTRRIIKTGKVSADKVLSIWEQAPDYIIKLMGYGWPGDLLWVRETWRLSQPYGPEDYYFDYKAHTIIGAKASSKYDFATPDVWRPSIHMPKEAARLWLTIKNLRVERLQDISDADAIAEGCVALSPKKAFCSLWEKIHGPKAWDENPGVFVIDFLKGREAGHE